MRQYLNANFCVYARQAVSVAVLALMLGVVAPAVRGQGNAPPIAKRETEENLQAKAATPDRLAAGAVLALQTGTLVWGFLGPQPITNEYWSGMANASGRVANVVVDPADPNTAYAAAAGGGVWSTNDGGMTWTPLTDGLSSLASGALALDANNPGSILYGTGEQNYSGDSAPGDGLFQSPDYGTTWTKIAPKSQVGSYTARVAVSADGSGTMHVCSDMGYLRSADGGATWSQFQPTSGWCNDLVQSAQGPGTWFAGFYGAGVYESTDDGMTWSQLSGGLPASGFQRINLGISDSNPGVVYASFINPSGQLFGMYKTTDGGSTWSPLPATPNYVCTQGWYDNAVAVSPTDPDTVYAAGVFTYCGNAGVIRSTNGGASWTNVTVAPGGGQVHPDQHSLVFGPDGTLWVGCDGGVWKTSDGAASWQDVNDGLGISQFYSVGIHSFDPGVLIGGTQDNGSVQYQGALAWPQIETGDGGSVAWEWANPDLYYTTYVQLNPLYKWLRPLTYQGTVTGPWAGDRADWGNGALVADPVLPNTLLVGTYRVFQSTNSGGSWSLISPDLTGGTGVLRALAVSPADSNTIYSGSSNGQVYMTSNRGMTWTLSNAGLPARTIPDIVADPNDPLTAYLCVDQPFGSRLFQTSDGGMTWNDLTGSLPDGVRAMSLAIDFNSGIFYLGTDSGVYSTPDGGATWNQEAINLPSVAVYQLRIDANNGLIVAATHGRGMWEAALTGM